jgi:hypothetical protein
MAVNREWLNELPRVPDAQLWRTDERQNFFSRAREGLADELVARSLYWTLRLGEEAGQWADRVEDLPGYQWAQIGFLSPDEDSLFARMGVHFGILAFCDDPDAEQSLLDVEVRVEDFSFPIGIQAAWFEPHVRVVSPSQGCVACWARSRRSTNPRSGWLTAGHVVPSGTTVTFSDGGTGHVVDRPAVCVDAAIVSTTHPPTGTNRATPANALAAGRTVELHDQHGRALSMTIHGVDPTLGATASRYLPLRFSLDSHGQAGDSGALVADPANGEVVGVYLGRYVDYKGGGAALGIGLVAHYLNALLDMEVWR